MNGKKKPGRVGSQVQESFAVNYPLAGDALTTRAIVGLISVVIGPIRPVPVVAPPGVIA